MWVWAWSKNIVVLGIFIASEYWNMYACYLNDGSAVSSPTKSRRSLFNNLKKIIWHDCFLPYPLLVQNVGVNDKYLNWQGHNKHTIEPFGASTSLVALLETQSVCRKLSFGLFFLLLIFCSLSNRTKVVKNVKRYWWGKWCNTKLLGEKELISWRQALQKCWLCWF